MSETTQRVVYAVIIALGCVTFVGWGAYFLFPGWFTTPEPTLEEWRTMLADGTPEERARAADALGHLHDEQSMNALLEAMRDENLQVRGRAGAAVQRILNADFYYRASASPEQREAAIERIEAHWKAWQEKRSGANDFRRMLAYQAMA